MSSKETAERLKELGARHDDVEARTKAADEALLASGEELKTLRAIARKLNMSKADLLAIVAPVASVRYLTSSDPYRYCVKDVLAAVEARRAARTTNR